MSSLFLCRIRQMIGSREFAEHIAHGDHREFELLCNMYGLPDYLPTKDSRTDLFDATDSIKYSAWQVLSPDFVTNNNVLRPSEVHWKTTTIEDEADESDRSNELFGMYLRKANSCPNMFPNSHTTEKVIMETEINIENTPVTMRILEEKSCDDGTENAFGNGSLTSVYEHNGIIRILTDSEVDEMNNSDTYTRGRTPRRVTFGGESIKLRTPDSDSVTQSDNDLKSRSRSLDSNTASSVAEILHIDIPVDNTKELSPPATLQRSESADILRTDNVSPVPSSPFERIKSARHRRHSPSSIVSPRPTHNGIEVLHNLQRSPLISPERHRRSLPADDDKINTNEQREHKTLKDEDQVEHIKNWEDLGLIDEESLANLNSGVSCRSFNFLICYFPV